MVNRQCSMILQIARSLFIVNEVIDGRMFTADGARRTLLHVDGAELHGLGIECQKTIRQQLADTCKVFQRLGSLDGTQHTSNSTQYTRLRTRRHSSYWRRLLKETAITGRTRQVCKGLSVEAQDAAMREWLACHHARIVDEELHGEVVGTVHHEVVFLDNIQRVT